MTQTWFDKNQSYLLDHWKDACQMEREMEDIRDMYDQLFQEILKRVRKTHRELDVERLEIKKYNYVSLARSFWPAPHPGWARSGFFIEEIRLEELASEEGDEPVARVWIAPPVGARFDFEKAKKTVEGRLKQLVSKRKWQWEQDKDGASLNYPLCESRSHLLKLLLRNNAKGFIDCVVSNFDLLARFTPELDRIFKKYKK